MDKRVVQDRFLSLGDGVNFGIGNGLCSHWEVEDLHMLDHMQKIVGRDTAWKMFVDMYG